MYIYIILYYYFAVIILLQQCSIDMQQLKNELETKILLLEKGIKEKTHQLQVH